MLLGHIYSSFFFFFLISFFSFNQFDIESYPSLVDGVSSFILYEYSLFFQVLREYVNLFGF